MPCPVLIVHDDAVALASMKAALLRAGVESAVIAGAPEAVVAFGDLAPSVVVLAPDMERGRGAALAKRLRNHPLGATVGFLLLGRALPELPDAPVLPLPIDEAALVKAVEESLALGKAAPASRGPRPFASGKWRGPVRVTELAPTAPDGAAAPPAPIPAAQALPNRGTLAQIDAASLVCRACDGSLTGLVDVAGRDARRGLWFEEGRLVAAASSASIEQIEEVALRLGLITTAQHHALRVSGERSARRLALRMVELGHIQAGELVALVRQYVLEILWAVFLDDESPYQFTSEVVPAEERIVLPMHPYALAMEGIRRKVAPERLWARLGGPATILRPRPWGLVFDDLGLTARERRFAERIDGLRTVEELLFEGGLDEAEALKVLHGLGAAGAVEIAVRALPLGASSKGALEQTIARAAEKLEHVTAGDYFQMLGLKRDASAIEVREAHERLAREFGPERAGADAGLRARLEEIRRGLDEAAEVLCDDEVRAEYARNLV